MMAPGCLLPSCLWDMKLSSLSVSKSYGEQACSETVQGINSYLLTFLAEMRFYACYQQINSESRFC